MHVLTKNQTLSCKAELQQLFKRLEIVIANTLVAKAKSLVSPYFGVQDLAFAYVA